MFDRQGGKVCHAGRVPVGVRLSKLLPALVASSVVVLAALSGCTTNTVIQKAAGDAGAEEGDPAADPASGSETTPGTDPATGTPASCTVCPKGCFDLESDPKNCGSCGKSCPTTAAGTAGVCVKGQCYEKCPNAGHTVCDGKCVDLKTDAANCGACGDSCGSPSVCTIPVCKAGSCADTFKEDWSTCIGESNLSLRLCNANGFCTNRVYCRKITGQQNYDLINGNVYDSRRLSTCSCQGGVLVGNVVGGGTYEATGCTSCRATADGAGYECH